MKIHLIIPPWRPEDIFPTKTASVQINYWEPLGTLYVASVLREKGHEVRFSNGAFLSENEILCEVESFSPDIAGIYSTTFGWKRAKRMASRIKGISSGIFTVAGGPYPIAMKDVALWDAPDLDGLIYGEGEHSMSALADALSQGRSLRSVKGL
ncbi:MAG: B12-binding domain-containing radical SAM protein, partial [Nitrospirae bacterium]